MTSYDQPGPTRRPVTGNTTVIRADHLIDIGRAEEAYALLKGDPETASDATALVALSHASDKLGEYREALEAAQAAIAIGPDNAPAWLLSAVALMKLERPVDALAQAREGVRLAPNHYGSHQILARVLTDLGRFDEANIHVRKTMELDPGGVSGWVTLCRLQLEQNRWGNAEQSARRALSIDPESDEAKILLGIAQHSTGDATKQAEAMETLVASLRSNPDQKHVRALLIELVKPKGLPIPGIVILLAALAGLGGFILIGWAIYVVHRWYQTPADVRRLVWADRRARWQILAGLLLATIVIVGFFAVLVAGSLLGQ